LTERRWPAEMPAFFCQILSVSLTVWKTLVTLLRFSADLPITQLKAIHHTCQASCGEAVGGPWMEACDESVFFEADA
jgi:hypothetical protein